MYIPKRIESKELSPPPPLDSDQNLFRSWNLYFIAYKINFEETGAKHSYVAYDVKESLKNNNNNNKWKKKSKPRKWFRGKNWYANYSNEN